MENKFLAPISAHIAIVVRALSNSKLPTSTLNSFSNNLQDGSVPVRSCAGRSGAELRHVLGSHEPVMNRILLKKNRLEWRLRSCEPLD